VNMPFVGTVNEKVNGQELERVQISKGLLDFLGIGRWD